MNTRERSNPEEMLDGPSQVQRRRGCLRFSLKTALLLLVLMAICFGTLHQYWWLPTQEQKTAVAKIYSYDYGNAGGLTYESDEEFPWWKMMIGRWFGKDSVTRVTRVFAEGTGGQMDISCWKGLKSVQYAGFDHALVSDLESLRHLEKLKEFSVYQSGMPQEEGETGLEVLGTLKELETVDLVSATFDFDNEVLASICNATTIRVFRFNTHMANDLSPLVNLSNLQELHIIFDQTSKRLVHNIGFLTKLRDLKSLTLTSYDKRQPFDYSVLKHLEKLESCTITGWISETQMKQIREVLPADCKITLKSL